ncbi:Uncharacterised 5xTM membrane BCR, YitT family COG1284 [Poseidonocella pacifica]|uniref:Uncharacterized 5xTM membrane BCR, YitT family COG1284 n=1 Tax=Poseidonocella pacifica TaxID=871651 RepID=A0A1I0YRD9_9RHOB|nr:YitT family protein [Poseidonocella pacifica]SFB14693.1 Uncharacterised 5xTM membrane BCR, YitT family COG1284 [Poseidonocella pacifica]
MQLLTHAPSDRHTLWEDVHGIVIGAALVALSIQFLRSADLLTGQIAGLALVLSYGGNWPFGVVFFLLNLPFYALAYTQLGPRFTFKSFLAVTLMSALAETMPLVITIDVKHPAAAAILFGICSGIGVLSLFRHGATLGGVGIVALWLQDRSGYKAGNTQLIFDLCVYLLALLLFPIDIVLWSLLGSVILNLIITINHRRDRYVARS